jgi:propanediol dehydratase small subunit
MNLIFIKNKEPKTTKDVIIESLKDLSEDKRSDNYMFFQNIKTICDAAKDIMEMDKDTVDEILSNGHDWASDHIATSKDDVEEVYNFLKNKI